MKIDEIRHGFERPFWVANISEIFERLSYYAVFSTLALYLNQTLGFSSALSASLSGIFGGAVWVMAIFGGALADRIGFRRALSAAYFILTCAYFMVGSIGAPWLAPVRAVVPLGLLAGVILFLPALGVALVKPSVVGTTARASKESVRSIGYAIYYTMVNIGSTMGPFLAGWLHSRLPPQDVFLIAALSVALMFFVVLIFFREPRARADESSSSLAKTARDFLTVFSNWRFVLFLVIFSGYWIVYWQQYLILPIYIHDYVDPNANTAMILITDPLIVITLTVAMNALTRRIPSFKALTLGTLVTSVGWLLIATKASVLMAILSLVVLALGEIIQSPRYYEYISRLAPPGQQGTYMGFAFLPIGIGSIVGGWFGGTLLQHYGSAGDHPATIWLIVTGAGVVTALLLWIYDRVFKPVLKPIA
ncbi:MAG: MFS transporter [Candidatus Eremiobacteraeota bacterium]|uniref:Major facilitator superfamily (MFS) profile domain-containing protein n=1 Tax=mine drainage metagenome TaxID=410659 RepID=E6PF72_9ZZZZ|nr:MFS transporter [Candidatus Eremiobacteraeota bacterium]